jgi:methylated-DNA-[protein]-cysteine S-methyltransferase
MFSLETRVGWLQVYGNQYFVTSSGFVFQKPEADYGSGILMARALEQLLNYLEDSSVQFDLPVMTMGTAFQQKVWSILETIPAGETRTYGELARAIGSSPRAVGGACKNNPVAVLVPCHRVVSAQGPGGYAGCTAGDNLQVKTWLLKHETC